MNLLHKIEIEWVQTNFFYFALAVSAPKLPGFITANIEEGAGEVGEKFAIEGVQKAQGGIVWFEGRAMFAPSTQGVFKSVGAFGQVVVGRMFEPAFKVAKGVEIGNQLDALVAAEVVKVNNIGGTKS